MAPRLCALLLLAGALCAAKPSSAPAPSHVVGVGLVVKIEGRFPVVDALIPDGPAARSARLKPGDRIEAVAEGEQAWVDASSMGLNEIVRRIRGPRGSSVSLRVVRSNPDGTRTQVTVTLTRDELKGRPAKTK